MKERWRVIPELPDFEASDLGRVRHKVTKKLATLTIRVGYVCVNIKIAGGNLIAPVHQLVCRAWYGPPELYLTKRGKKFLQEVRHLDDNRKNNRLRNLRWGTRKENTEDMFANGIRFRRNDRREMMKMKGTTV